ncbi:MAG: beta-ketoacyl-[acyl-carrier-protein] synthase family protein [Pirellulaceae bacterium]|nr:beta-ketoacyl-[acyl-carrier-protein] synthase family protein [Pirellulaceae bacterium]
MAELFDVVITGVGVVSPIGIGRQAFWSALREARSGVGTFERLRGSSWPVQIAAEVRDFDGKAFVSPRKALKVMSRELQLGYAAGKMAMEDAGLPPGSVAPERLGVVFASDMLFCDIDELVEPFRQCVDGGEFHFEQWGPRAIGQLFPLWMLKYLPNMTACHIGIAEDARGPNNTIVQGDASSLLALIEAANLIRRGHADVVLTGGASSRLSMTPMMFRGPLNMSRRNDDPAAACRPFDADRDGQVGGEGAGCLVLEHRRHAEARGATLLAAIGGYGCTFDPRCHHAQASAGDAIARSLELALHMADLAPDDVDHVNAHGLSTIEHDRREAQAIQRVLGDVPVTAPKSLFGNLGAGGGSVEAVASVLAMQAGEVPPTLNYDRPDPECPVRVVTGQPLAAPQEAAVVMSQSTTGQVASVALVAP